MAAHLSIGIDVAQKMLRELLLLAKIDVLLLHHDLIFCVLGLSSTCEAQSDHQRTDGESRVIQDIVRIRSRHFDRMQCLI
jgi:hypothetical protein